MNNRTETPSRPPSTSATSGSRPAAIASDRLLGHAGRLFIHHRGETYLLRITRQGRLLLTK